MLPYYFRRAVKRTMRTRWGVFLVGGGDDNVVVVVVVGGD
jgi:hypothetical protein